jgi:hypothetical protein
MAARNGLTCRRLCRIATESKSFLITAAHALLYEQPPPMRISLLLFCSLVLASAAPARAGTPEVAVHLDIHARAGCRTLPGRAYGARFSHGGVRV